MSLVVLPAAPCGASQRNQDATVYCGNLDENVNDELLWELMIQVGATGCIAAESRERVWHSMKRVTAGPLLPAAHPALPFLHS